MSQKVLEPIFLCTTDDVPEGTHFPISLFGRRLIVFNKMNNYAVYENRCSHRGMPFTYEPGTCKLTCRYHGKSFSFNNPLEMFQCGKFLLFKRPSEETDQALSEFSSRLGEKFGELETYTSAPFHLWMANTMDPHHLRVVHKNGFAKMFDDPPRVFEEMFATGDYLSSYKIRVKDSVRSEYMRHFKMSMPLSFSHVSLFPNLSLTSFLGVFYSIETMIPCVNGTKIKTAFYTRKNLKVSKLLCNLAMRSNRKTLDEDAELLNEFAKTYDPNREINWLPGEDRVRKYLELYDSHTSNRTD